MYQNILYQKENGVARITMNRPEQRNAVSVGMRRELIDALNDAKSDPSIVAAVLAANGKSFCAGRDLNEVKANASAPMSDIYRDYASTKEFTDCFERFPKPLIAAVNGHALGFGTSLAAYCDLIVAGESACFGFPEININIVPGIASVKIAELIGKRRMSEMILLGARYTSQQALEMGLINKVVPDDQTLSQAMQWAGALAALDPMTVQLSKQFIGNLGKGTYDFEAFSSLGVMCVGFANKNKR